MQSDTKGRANRILITVLLFGAIGVVAFNTWLAFRSIDVLLESERWVQHTLGVINQVEQIIGSAKDAETGSRGYLITGDAAYLQPYTSAIRELPGELDQFGKLTADNPSQQARLVEMRAVLEQRLALLASGVAERGNGVPGDELRLLVQSGTGKAEMDHLRQLADQMDAEEQRLLVQRREAAHSSSRRARLTIGFASALDLVLLVLTFRYLSRERERRFRMEQVAEQLALAHAETEAKAAEIQALNLELEERVLLRTAELETTNRELEAFSYSVSHDLRAPLRTIDGFSLALEEDYAEAVDATGRDYIRRVRAGVQRMGQLIDALLQLSRITRADLVREEFDLSQMAHSVVAQLEVQIRGKDGEGNPVLEPGTAADGKASNTVDFRVEDGLRANGDPKLIQVALENLIGNAVKFSSKVANPVVEFGWDREQSAWFVRDNGAGFDMFYADKLFNAFNRLHGDKDFKGSGIGLATVARVVRRHHGRIWADSVVDHGATFWFTLG
jgi:signal transduction histidine kinase